MAGTLGRGIALGLTVLIGLHLVVPVSVIWLIDVRPLPRWVGGDDPHGGDGGAGCLGAATWVYLLRPVR